MIRKLSATLLLLLTGCVTVPEGIRPVTNFELERYLGTWYEIARLDHPFERGLSRVSAHYSLRDDGRVRVINRGYLEAEERWKEAEGVARFVRQADEGFLKVSFFGPFYGAYVVFALDQQDYHYALVSGPDRSYLWLLAREPHIDEALRNMLVARASAAGFATDQLIFVAHP